MATYYCWSGATGLNNGLTQADAWTSLQSFLSIKGNSDICYLKGTQTLAASLTDAIALANDTPAWVIGVDAAWAETGERAIIDANSAAAYCFDYNGGGSYLNWKNVEFINPNTACIRGNTSYQGCSLVNCKLSNATTGINSKAYATIFQTYFTSTSYDFNNCQSLHINCCVGIAGARALYNTYRAFLNCSIFHDYSTSFVENYFDLYINNAIFDDAPVGVTGTERTHFSNTRITNITGNALNITQAGGGNGYCNMYFYNPAGTDIGGAKSGAIIDLGYNRLTPSNAATGYNNVAVHDFTLDPNTDPSVGVAIPLGWVNETVNIGYLTAGVPPEYPSPSTPTSAGITRFEPLTNGRFYVEWDPGSGTITNYNIYLKAGSAPSFTAVDCVKHVCYVLGINYTIIALEPDQETLLRHGIDYYCSVKAANGSSQDANTAVLNNLCSGAEGIQRQINTHFVIR